MLLATKVLFTILTLGYSLIPTLADFNKTHATNPLWTGHARFHLVWQVASYELIALMVIALLWLPIVPDQIALGIAVALAIAIYGGFFVAVFTKRAYGGANYDTNGYLPVKGPLGLKFDANITIFSIMAVLTAAAGALMAQFS